MSSLCTLTDGFTVTTATSSGALMGTVIEMDRNGKARSKCKVARQVCHPVVHSLMVYPHSTERDDRHSLKPIQATSCASQRV